MSPALSDDLRDELLTRWSEPHRRHHDGAHLREVLDAVAQLAEHGLVFDRRDPGVDPTRYDQN
jgi:hypothetical protein